MSENKQQNRVVVTDEAGEVQKVKSDAEIVRENEKLEAALKPEEQPAEQPKVEEKPELDPSVLSKLKQKQEAKEEPMKAVAKRDRSLYFGVVGLGQAGSRIAETFYGLGYEACVFNTATQDLEHIKLPEQKKIFLPFALGGAGKELDNGRQSIEQNGELVLQKLNESFGASQEMLILAVSGGGGTGSGGAEAIIGLMASLGKPLGVIYVLPMESEDALSKHNAVTTLSKLAKMASTDVITTLMVVDNSKIELIYPGLSKAEFWTTANSAIVEPLHIFNHLSAMPTQYDSLDSMDFGRVFTTGDCTVYGMLEVLDYMETTSIAEAVIENLEAGLLASDFNLKETRFGGYIVTASAETLRKLPAVNIDYANHVISEACDSPSLVRGVYEMDMEDDVVRVYTLFSGLGLPSSRIDSLKTQATEQMAVIREKEKTRADRMNVEYGPGSEVQVKAQEVHRIIQQKKSGFGKLTQNAGKRIIDRRKR
jgi:cell division GTPase FtsZ